MLKDLSEEKLNLCKDIRRVVKTFLRQSSDIMKKHEVVIKDTHGRKVLFFLRSSVKKMSNPVSTALCFFSQYNRVLVLA